MVVFSPEKGGTSGLPFLHGARFPHVAAPRRLAINSHLQLASGSPSPWSVVGDDGPSQERASGIADGGARHSSSSCVTEEDSLHM